MNIHSERGLWARIPLRLKNPAIRLICFPHAGSGASTYFRWLRRLQFAKVELVSIQYPGREDRFEELPAISIEDLADQISSIWGSLSESYPCAIFGHSMGGTLGFEVVRRLYQARVINPPKRLFISGRNPPHVPWPGLSIRHLPDSAFLKEIENRYGALPKEITQDDELASITAGILRADLLLVERYVSEPISLPILMSVFGGVHDAWTSIEKLREWQQYSQYPIKLRMMPGGHFFHHSAEEKVMGAILTDLGLGPF